LESLDLFGNPAEGKAATRRPSVSKEQCIEEILRIADEHPDRTLSRNFFRVESFITEYDWSFWFGTFPEFKKAAGLSPTRFETKESRDTAVHASKDILTALEADRLSWSNTYDRPSDERFQDILVCSDTHDVSCDPFFRRIFVDTAERVNPKKIVLNGDIFDLPEFSKFENDPRNYNVIERYQWVQDFLRDLREAAPDSEIIMIEGNHEYRVCRSFAEATPSTKTWLSDIHGFDMRKWLGLDKWEVNYHARGSLKAFNVRDIKKEITKNFYCFNNQLLFHHFPEGRKRGMPGASGHLHKHDMWASYHHLYGPVEWHQMGGGHVRFNDYQQSMGEQWGNGFLICHADTKTLHTQMNYIDCSNEHCVVDGKYYLRNEAEKNFCL
jgi:predicted phosphodiesterase